jgi:hypothetical protein
LRIDDVANCLAYLLSERHNWTDDGEDAAFVLWWSMMLRTVKVDFEVRTIIERTNGANLLFLMSWSMMLRTAQLDLEVRTIIERSNSENPLYVMW